MHLLGGDAIIARVAGGGGGKVTGCSDLSQILLKGAELLSFEVIWRVGGCFHNLILIHLYLMLVIQN